MITVKKAPSWSSEPKTRKRLSRLILLGLLPLSICNSALAVVKYDPNELAKSIVLHQYELEKKLYSSMPDIVDCKRAKWMDNCETVNFLLKKNNGGPIRVKSIDGVTQTLSSETPTQLINILIGGDARAIAEYYKYLEHDRKRNDEVGQQISAFFRAKKFNGDNAPTLNHELESIDLSNYILSVFVSQYEPGSKGIVSVASSLKKTHPTLKVQIIAVNSDLEWIKNSIDSSEFDKVDSATSTVVKKWGVDTYPTIYISEMGEGNSAMQSGFMSKVQLQHWIHGFILSGKDK